MSGFSIEAKQLSVIIIACYFFWLVNFTFFGLMLFSLAMQLHEDVVDEVLIDSLFEREPEDPDYAFATNAVQRRLMRIVNYKLDNLVKHSSINLSYEKYNFFFFINSKQNLFQNFWINEKIILRSSGFCIKIDENLNIKKGYIKILIHDMIKKK